MGTLQERITTAGVLIHEGNIFIARRMEGGSIGGLWEFPGGKNRWGETPQQTLEREYKEEFGFSIEVGDLIHTHDFVNKETLYHLLAYFVTSADPFHPVLRVHQEYRWVSLGELSGLALAPSDLEIYTDLENILK